MDRPARPQLADDDDLTRAADIDIDAALAPLLEQRSRSPIVRPSRAADAEALIDTSEPRGGESLDTLVEQLTRAFDTFPRRNAHPGFFGWVAPSGLPSDPLAYAMLPALQQNIIGYWASPIGTSIEKTVIRWLADLCNYPASAEGILLSGGSQANMTAIAAACSRKFGLDYRHQGLLGTGRRGPPKIVCSNETHFSVRRAAVLLGIGSDNILSLDGDEQMRLRTDSLEQALAGEDNVVCVVATAGTTNTGAIDPLDAIADLCRRHGVWLHVDAALGGGGLMSPQLRPRYRGIERADSITVDLHKWFFQSLDCSLLLYRDAAPARQLLAESSDYVPPADHSIAEEYAFFHISPELSRRMRALPVYLALRHYGIEKLGRNVLHNVECAEYLAALVEADERLELVVAPQLSIVCFRYRPADLDDTEVDRLNREIREHIQLEGDYLISPTQVRGRPVLRACILNHATRAQHIDGLVEAARRIGDALAQTRE